MGNGNSWHTSVLQKWHHCYTLSVLLGKLSTNYLICSESSLLCWRRKAVRHFKIFLYCCGKEGKAVDWCQSDMAFTFASVRTDKSQLHLALTRPWAWWGADAMHSTPLYFRAFGFILVGNCSNSKQQLRCVSIRDVCDLWIHSGSEHLEVGLFLQKRFCFETCFWLFPHYILITLGEKSGLRLRNFAPWHMITVEYISTAFFSLLPASSDTEKQIKTHFSHRSLSALFTPPHLIFLTRSLFVTSLIDLITLPLVILVAHFPPFLDVVIYYVPMCAATFKSAERARSAFLICRRYLIFPSALGCSDDTVFEATVQISRSSERDRAAVALF